MLKGPCDGEHKVFVADTVGVPSEGMVFLILVCTLCGDTDCRGFKVTDKASVPEIKLASDQKGK